MSYLKSECHGFKGLSWSNPLIGWPEVNSRWLHLHIECMFSLDQLRLACMKLEKSSKYGTFNEFWQKTVEDVFSCDLICIRFTKLTLLKLSENSQTTSRNDPRDTFLVRSFTKLSDSDWFWLEFGPIVAVQFSITSKQKCITWVILVRRFKFLKIHWSPVYLQNPKF